MGLLPYMEAGRMEAGCDEVGRGCLAGPVVAAAVILPEDFRDPGLNDSKKLPERKRNEFAELIRENALAFAVAEIPPKRIDEINILNASFEAMHFALDQLPIVPGHLLIDGNRFSPYADIPHNCVIKGDSKYLSIAAASILAKTYRDDLMAKLHNSHPYYGWDTNVGYPTKKHRAAIKEHGVTKYHRRSFNLLGGSK